MAKKAPSPAKSKSHIARQMRLFAARHPDWKQYEEKMAEIAPRVARGEPMDIMLEKLYAAAKSMDKPLVEIAHA